MPSGYLVVWTVGWTLGGIVAWQLARRHGLPSGRSAVVILVAAYSLAIGAVAQFRLEHYSLGEALLFNPHMRMIDGGHRVPLGLLVGAGAGAATALALSVPWARLADFLAIGTCVMMSIGRFGCFINGCCGGAVCSALWHPICLRYGPGSDSYGLQLGEQLIKPGTPLSLPVHPLPLYFVTACVLIGGAGLILIRRGARPGSVAWLFTLIYPATQLALEGLRATTGGANPALNVPILTGEVIAGVLAFAWLRLGMFSARELPAGQTSVSC